MNYRVDLSINFFKEKLLCAVTVERERNSGEGGREVCEDMAASNQPAGHSDTRHGSGEAHRRGWNGKETATATRKKMMPARVDVGHGAPRLAELDEGVAEGEEETTKPAVASPGLGDTKRQLECTPKRHDGNGASVVLERHWEWEKEVSGVSFI